MYKIIDGKKISSEIFNELKQKINLLKLNGKNITLADIQIGVDEASKIYIISKIKKFKDIGINFNIYNFNDNDDESDIIKFIEKLNDDKNINGIFIEVPVSKKFNQNLILNKIDKNKDVEGVTLKNMGALFSGEETFCPCTADGIIELLIREKIEINGKHVVIINRSNIVGKPLAILFLRQNATVTICHSKTLNIKNITKSADILVVANGKINSIDSTYVKDGAIVIDVGIHYIYDENNNRKICGDVNFNNVAPHTSYITPVPGGVGAMTTIMLIKHCVESAAQNE